MAYASHFYLRNSEGILEEITNIEIPNTITEIGVQQFRGFNNLISITIPESVTNIGEYSFYGCSNLRSVAIPESVTNIVEYSSN